MSCSYERKQFAGSSLWGGRPQICSEFLGGRFEEEYYRLKDLNIGKMTEIVKVHEGYYFFNIYDPDNNVCEVTGGYTEV